MKKILFLQFILICLTTLPYKTLRAEDEEKTFKKGSLTFKYPANGWKIEELPAVANKASVNVRVTADGSPKLYIIATWEPDGPKPSAEEEMPNSAEISGAFGLPIALSIANQRSENIITSVGIININEITQLSTRYVIVTPGSSATKTIDTFAYMSEDKPGNAIVGGIISEGDQKPDQLNSNYYDRLYEAYGIVQTMTINNVK